MFTLNHLSLLSQYLSIFVQKAVDTTWSIVFYYIVLSFLQRRLSCMLNFNFFSHFFIFFSFWWFLFLHLFSTKSWGLCLHFLLLRSRQNYRHQNHDIQLAFLYALSFSTRKNLFITLLIRSQNSCGQTVAFIILSYSLLQYNRVFQIWSCVLHLKLLMMYALNLKSSNVLDLLLLSFVLGERRGYASS